MKCTILTFLFVAVATKTFTAQTYNSFSDANWISLGGLPGLDGSASALVVNTNAGLVYVAGTLTIAAKILTTNIVQWNVSIWSPLGSGVDGSINALALDNS